MYYSKKCRIETHIDLYLQIIDDMRNFNKRSEEIKKVTVSNHILFIFYF